MELGKNTTQYWSPDQYSGVILDRVSFHGRFVHFHLPSFLPSFLSPIFEVQNHSEITAAAPKYCDRVLYADQFSHNNVVAVLPGKASK